MTEMCLLGGESKGRATSSKGDIKSEAPVSISIMASAHGMFIVSQGDSFYLLPGKDLLDYAAPDTLKSTTLLLT